MGVSALGVILNALTALEFGIKNAILTTILRNWYQGQSALQLLLIDTQLSMDQLWGDMPEVGEAWCWGTKSLQVVQLVKSYTAVAA